MQCFCIDKRVIGTRSHLVSNGNGFAWIDRIPSNTWHLTGYPKTSSKRCLDTALALAGRTIDVLPPEVHRNAVELFGNVADVPWASTMTPQAHRTFVKSLVKKVDDAMADLDTSYYDDTWVLENGVFESLQPAKLDVSKFNALLSKLGTNAGVLGTFKPVRGNQCQKIAYDRLATRTGRLTVSKGPNVLALNHEYRDIISSEYGDSGQILQLDFNALEIRGIYYENGNEDVAGDFYVALAANFHRPISRDIVKKIVIPALYGHAHLSLAQQLNIEPDELLFFMKSIKAKFKIDVLLKKLRHQNIEFGGIKNHYGRFLHIPSASDHILLNTFAQSTGVDVSLLGFSNIIRKLPASARPIFLIHDSLVIDVKKDDVQLLDNLKHVNVKGFDQRFLLKISTF